VTPGPAQAREILESLELGVEIYSGRAEKFILKVTNYSDFSISVSRIRMESANVELTRPAEPAEKNGWVIAPRNTFPIAWNASPDPASSLMSEYGGPERQMPVDVIIQCDYFGVIRKITKRIIVTVSRLNRVITHIVG
jgi:hypothetical protein